MGYYVRALPTKKSLPHWKIQFISHRKIDFEGSNAKKPKKEWDVPKEQWRANGFHGGLSLAEARARARQLNAQLRCAAIADRRRQIEIAREKFKKTGRAHFPEEFSSEFETRYIGTHGSKSAAKNRHAHWRAAQRLILEVNREPQDWYDHASEFYDYFCRKKFSMSYLRKVIRFANLWGFFISRKLAMPFLSIPLPRGYERARLLNAYYSKGRQATRESDPISDDQLIAAKGEMRKTHLNWLAMGVWFGLRPHEIDALRSKDSFLISQQPDGTDVLWVFQTKLISVAPWKRWKGIPILFPAQRDILTEIQRGQIRRPSSKTIKKYFGSTTSAYGGRKGFVDLMLARGVSLENISQWLGHRSIERTWANYKDMRSFRVFAA